MIAVLDYGAGNLASVLAALRAVGEEPVAASAVERLARASGIVVPGVGHFGATAAIEAGVREALLERARAGVPLLGICLGMQWLFDGSDEAPALGGLRLFAGRCTRLRACRPLKVPHVGWNTLVPLRPSALLEGLGRNEYVYFTHSFAAPIGPECAAVADHGGTFAAAVERAHVWGVQFHPEKSGDAGLRILRNFVRMTRA